MAYPQYQPQYPPQPQYPYQPPPQYQPQYQPPPTLVPTMRVDMVQGTPFGVAYPTVQPVPSGQAIGALVAGIAAVLVGLFAICLGAAGGSEGWGLAAGGAFTILGVFLGGGALGLGLYGGRQIRRAQDRALSGRGMAITGVVLGAVGAGLALFALVVALAVA